MTAWRFLRKNTSVRRLIERAHNTPRRRRSNASMRGRCMLRGRCMPLASQLGGVSESILFGPYIRARPDDGNQ